MQCTICEGGLIRINDGYNRCECQREKIVNKLFKQSETPFKFHKYSSELCDQTITTPKGSEVSYLELINNLTGDEEKVKLMIERDVRIVLKGNPGSGKTQMAASVALEIAKQFDIYQPELAVNRFYFLDARGIGNWMFEKEERNRIFNKVKKSNILIIDDLGTENTTNNFITSALDELVRQFKGILIITTNLSGELRKTYEAFNERLSDVLFPNLEKDHGKFNTLYYNIITPEGISRRMESVEDLNLI